MPDYTTIDYAGYASDSWLMGELGNYGLTEIRSEI